MEKSEEQFGCALTMLTCAFVSALSTFLFLFVFLALSESVPRLDQGESMVIPWPAYTIAYAAISIIPSWVISCWVTKNWKVRVAFLGTLFLAMFFWYHIAGWGQVLFKSWSRGL